MDEIAQLYARFLPRVRSIALRILGDGAEAEDVAQDAFVELCRSRAARGADSVGSVPGEARLSVIVRSRALDRLRRRRVALLAEPRAHPDLVQREPDASSRHFFVEALGLLSERQRVVIELAYGQGMTHDAIARQLGEPLGTVKTRIRAGLQRLLQLLEAEPAPAIVPTA